MRRRKGKQKEKPSPAVSRHASDAEQDDREEGAQASELDERMGSLGLAEEVQGEAVANAEECEMQPAAHQLPAAPDSIDAAARLIERENAAEEQERPFVKSLSKQQKRAAKALRVAQEAAERMRSEQRDMDNARPRRTLQEQVRLDRRLAAGMTELQALTTSVSMLYRQWAEWLWPLLVPERCYTPTYAHGHWGLEERYVEAVRVALQKLRRHNHKQREQNNKPVPLTVRSVMHYYANRESHPYRQQQLERLLNTFINMHVASEATRMRDALINRLHPEALREMRQNPRIMLSAELAERVAPDWVTFMQGLAVLHRLHYVTFEFLTLLLMVYRGHVEQSPVQAWVQLMLQQLVSAFHCLLQENRAAPKQARRAWVREGEAVSVVRTAARMGPQQYTTGLERIAHDGSVTSHESSSSKADDSNGSDSGLPNMRQSWKVKRDSEHKIDMALYIASAAQLWKAQPSTVDELARHRRHYGPAVQQGIRAQPLPHARLAASPLHTPPETTGMLTPDVGTPRHSDGEIEITPAPESPRPTRAEAGEQREQGAEEHRAASPDGHAAVANRRSRWEAYQAFEDRQQQQPAAEVGQKGSSDSKAHSGADDMPVPKGHTAQDKQQHDRAMAQWWTARQAEAAAIEASIRERNQRAAHANTPAKTRGEQPAGVQELPTPASLGQSRKQQPSTSPADAAVGAAAHVAGRGAETTAAPAVAVDPPSRTGRPPNRPPHSARGRVRSPSWDPRDWDVLPPSDDEGDVDDDPPPLVPEYPDPPPMVRPLDSLWTQNPRTAQRLRDRVREFEGYGRWEDLLVDQLPYGPPMYRVGDAFMAVTNSYTVGSIQVWMESFSDATLTQLMAAAVGREQSRQRARYPLEARSLAVSMARSTVWRRLSEEQGIPVDVAENMLPDVLDLLFYYLPTLYHSMQHDMQCNATSLWHEDSGLLRAVPLGWIRGMFAVGGWGEELPPCEQDSPVQNQHVSFEKQLDRDHAERQTAGRTQGRARVARQTGAPPPGPREGDRGAAPRELQQPIPFPVFSHELDDMEVDSPRDKPPTATGAAGGNPGGSDPESDDTPSRHSRDRAPRGGGGAGGDRDVVHRFTHWGPAGEPRTAIACIRVTEPEFSVMGNLVRSAQSIKPLFTLPLPTTPYPAERSAWGSTAARAFLDIFRKYCLNHFMMNAQGDRIVGMAGEPDQCISLILHLFPLELRNRIKAVGSEMGDERAKALHPTIGGGKCIGDTAMDYLLFSELELIVFLHEGKATDDAAKRKLKFLKYDPRASWTANYNIWEPLVRQLKFSDLRKYNSMAVFVDSFRPIQKAMFGEPGALTREVVLPSTTTPALATAAYDTILSIGRVYEKECERLSDWRKDNAERTKSYLPANPAAPYPPAGDHRQAHQPANPRKRQFDPHEMPTQPQQKPRPDYYTIVGGSKQSWEDILRENPHIPAGLGDRLPRWLRVAARDGGDLCSNCWKEFHGDAACDAPRDVQLAARKRAKDELAKARAAAAELNQQRAREQQLQPPGGGRGWGNGGRGGGRGWRGGARGGRGDDRGFQGRGRGGDRGRGPDRGRGDDRGRGRDGHGRGRGDYQPRGGGGGRA
jgi:hypothetical protein